MESSQFSPPPAKLARTSLGSEMGQTSINITGTTVEVKVESETFYVHKNIICAKSPFFRNATKPEWTTSSAQPIELTDTTPETFRTYVAYLYS
ncbi:hypothetical protein BDV96DRAFT_640179 [Lophiotrema nucula]|uniref:BTB domain-containing protein n=1 Tax=Lophiotrema nucula TaxID=690887 RepID=A0A6A5ZSZ1_9PLEO|nr:hypothetical protein BDV96DRAFT_640179 [Lophiotrema nucula]